VSATRVEGKDAACRAAAGDFLVATRKSPKKCSPESRLKLPALLGKIGSARAVQGCTNAARAHGCAERPNSLAAKY